MDKAFVLIILIFASPAFAQGPGPGLDPLVDYRYCGPPKRNPDGTIYRSSPVTAAYQRIHPCPSTGLAKGACPGWALNHAYPLADGGCDAVFNLQWMPNAIKSCALSTGVPCIDRWERKIFANPMVIVK